MNISTYITSNKITLSNVSQLLLLLKEHYQQVKPSATVTPAVAYRYKGNLIGLLKNELNIDEDMLYLTMLINGYYDSSSYDGRLNEFAVLNKEMMNFQLGLALE